MLGNSTSCVQLTRSDAIRVLERVINYAIFMPDLGPTTTRLLVSGEVTQFIQETTRLATLGSRPAAALLAYLHLQGAVDGHPSPETAERAIRRKL